MSLKFLLIIFCFGYVHLVLGQEITKADIIKFKIKSVATIDDEGKTKFIEFYNDKGDFIKQASFDDSDKLKVDRELIYNDSAQLVEERTYSTNGDINSKTNYYYDNKNQLIKKESISNGEVDAVWNYDYDGKGNKILEKQTSAIMGNYVTTFKYDINNLVIQEDKTNNTIGKEERVNYKYSDKKQLLEKKTKSYYFNTVITLTYVYDEEGKLKELKEKSSDGVTSATTYEYNDKGLLISDTWEDSLSKTLQKTSYQINYE